MNNLTNPPPRQAVPKSEAIPTPPPAAIPQSSSISNVAETLKNIVDYKGWVYPTHESGFPQPPLPPLPQIPLEFTRISANLTNLTKTEKN